MNQASDNFISAFDSNCAGCRRTCICGIEHFDSSDNGWDWEEGELESLKLNAQNQPNRYIEHDGSVGTLLFSGNEIVLDCTCDYAKRAERLLTENLSSIIKYIRLEQKSALQKAKDLEI